MRSVHRVLLKKFLRLQQATEAGDAEVSNTTKDEYTQFV